MNVKKEIYLVVCSDLWNVSVNIIIVMFVGRSWEACA